MLTTDESWRSGVLPQAFSNKLEIDLQILLAFSNNLSIFFFFFFFVIFEGIVKFQHLKTNKHLLCCGGRC